MFSVEITGEIDNWLGAKHREMSNTMERKVQTAAFSVEREAKNNLKEHVSTGRLIRGVSSKVVKRGFASWAAVGTDVVYGSALEHGTDPHWAPIRDLERWAKQRGLNPYAVQRNISGEGTTAGGTKAHPWLIPARNKVLSAFDWSL